MSKYRKKPVVVDAFRWTADHEQTEDPIWIVDALQKEWGEEGSARIIDMGNPSVRMEIVTLEGIHTARRGDYIIRGIKGEMYPCKPDIFEQTYDPVEGGDEWYCERCKQYVPGREVTHDEYHDGCGGRCR